MTGREIKELRKALKWSQMKMALEVGCHLSTIQKLEGKGEAGHPSPLVEKGITAIIVKVEKK